MVVVKKTLQRKENGREKISQNEEQTTTGDIVESQQILPSSMQLNSQRIHSNDSSSLENVIFRVVFSKKIMLNQLASGLNVQFAINGPAKTVSQQQHVPIY